MSVMFRPVDQSAGHHYTIVPSGSANQSFIRHEKEIQLGKHRKIPGDVDLTSISKNRLKNQQVVHRCDDLNDAQNNSKLKIENRFVPGCVVLGSKSAVEDLLCSGLHFKRKTGVVIERSIHPSSSNQLNENEQYTLEEKLGGGSFGIVCSHKHSVTKKDFVIKKIIDRFHRKEVDILMQLDHPNITKFLGFVVDNEIPEILMEYAGPSLKKLMESGTFQEISDLTNILEICLQGCAALKYMHQYGIWHLDIKPENICILIKPELILKITDFGSVKTPQDPISFTGWTPEYMSPEACILALEEKLQKGEKKVQLSEKADTYSFGLTVAFMMSSYHIVQQLIIIFLMREEERKDQQKYMERRSLILFYVARDLNLVKKHAIKSNWPEVIRTLLENTLEGDANIRWSAAQALDYIKLKVGQKQLPTVVGSPVCQGDGNSPDFSQLKSSLGSKWPDEESTTGKMIRNKLRNKLKGKHGNQPYELRDKVEPEKVQNTLPIFNEIM